MSIDCKTPELIHSDTPQCSPVHKMDEKTQAPGVLPAIDKRRKSLILTIGYKTANNASKTEKAPYVKKIMEDGKVIINKERQTKKKCGPLSSSSSRLVLGFLPTGQRLVLKNCPMKNLCEDSSTDTDES